MAAYELYEKMRKQSHRAQAHDNQHGTPCEEIRKAQMSNPVYPQPEPIVYSPKCEFEWKGSTKKENRDGLAIFRYLGHQMTLTLPHFEYAQEIHKLMCSALAAQEKATMKKCRDIIANALPSSYG